MRVLTVISFLFGCPYCAHAQNLSAADILKKVAEKYRLVSSISVVAERKVELDTDTSEEKYSAGNVEGTVSGSFAASQLMEVTLMVSSSSKAKLWLKNNKKEIVAVTDGKVVWTLLPAHNAYTELPARSPDINRYVFMLRIGSDQISGMNLLEEYEALVADRFRSISDWGPWARLQRSKALKVGKGQKECYVLTIQIPRDSQKHKLWIDKKEFTVWKTVDKTVFPTDYSGDTLHTTVTLTTKQMSLNPSLQESEFVFRPPDHAKRVQSLKLSGYDYF